MTSIQDLHSAAAAKRFLVRCEWLATTIALVSVLLYAYISPSIVHFLYLLAPEGVAALLGVLSAVLGGLIVGRLVWVAVWRVINDAHGGAIGYAVHFWTTPSSFKLRDLVSRKHPLVESFLRHNRGVKSTIEGLSSKAAEPLRERAAYNWIDTLVRDKRTVLMSTGEFTVLSNQDFLNNVARRPQDWGPVQLVGFLKGQPRTYGDFFAALQKHAADLGELREEVPLEFTAETQRQVRELMDIGKLKVRLLREELEEPHCGIFDQAIYIQQRHRHGRRKDVTIVETPRSELHAQLENSLNRLLADHASFGLQPSPSAQGPRAEADQTEPGLGLDITEVEAEESAAVAFTSMYLDGAGWTFLHIARIAEQHPTMTFEDGLLAAEFLDTSRLYEEAEFPASLRYRDRLEDLLSELSGRGLEPHVATEMLRIRQIDERLRVQLRASLRSYKSLEEFWRSTDGRASQLKIERKRWWNYPIASETVPLEELCRSFGIDGAEAQRQLAAFEQ